VATGAESQGGPENEYDVFPLTDPRVVAVIKRISAGLCTTVRSGCASRRGATRRRLRRLRRIEGKTEAGETTRL